MTSLLADGHKILRRDPDFGRAKQLRLRRASSPHCDDNRPVLSRQRSGDEPADCGLADPLAGAYDRNARPTHPGCRNWGRKLKVGAAVDRIVGQNSAGDREPFLVAYYRLIAEVDNFIWAILSDSACDGLKVVSIAYYGHSKTSKVGIGTDLLSAADENSR